MNGRRRVLVLGHRRSDSRLRISDAQTLDQPKDRAIGDTDRTSGRRIYAATLHRDTHAASLGILVNKFETTASETNPIFLDKFYLFLRHAG